MEKVLEKYNITSLKWDVALEKRLKNKRRLENFGFKVYSQSDEDGIIEEIFERIGTTNKIFVEFGVDNGIESNSHYLLLKGWSGLWIEGSEDNVNEINRLFRPAIQKDILKVSKHFINRDNINEIIRENFISGEIDFLSIDIDGNDIYIWESINIIKPRVVCIEYNGKIPPTCLWRQPYNPYHIWNRSDYTGASLKDIVELGKQKGYLLVGTNTSGVNAFFVRMDLCKMHFVKAGNIMELYNPPRFGLVCQSIGHPSSAFIGLREEPCYWYQNDDNVQFVTGFSYNETMENGDRFAWTNALESVLLIKNNGTKEYSIDTYIHENNTEVTIIPEGSDSSEFCLDAGENTLNFRCKNVSLNEIWIKIIIKINRLWVPNCVDTRELGIAIFKEKRG